MPFVITAKTGIQIFRAFLEPGLRQGDRFGGLTSHALPVPAPRWACNLQQFAACGLLSSALNLLIQHN